MNLTHGASSFSTKLVNFDPVDPLKQDVTEGQTSPSWDSVTSIKLGIFMWKGEL